VTVFDVYIQEQSMPAQRRIRLLMAGILAMAAVSTAGAAATIAQRLDIHAVEAARRDTSLTVILPQVAPAAPKPPPPVERNEAVAAGSASNGRTTRPRSKVSSTPAAPIDETATPRASSKTGGGEGPINFGGPLPGIDRIGKGGRCIVPPCSDGPVTTADPPNDPVVAPLAQVKARGIFTPDPDRAELAKTATGMGSRHPGAVTVEFCTGANGKTHGVKVAKSFGDRKVDEIARAAVKRWRFRPMLAGGRAVETCSEVTFRIEFE
jgi:TonB family protein